MSEKKYNWQIVPDKVFFSVHLSFMVMSADWCTSSSQVCMSSTSVLTPFEKSCMHNKLQNLFSKGHGCTPFYVSKKAKKLFFCFQKSQTSKHSRAVDCRVGKLIREVFWGLKLPRTFTISSPIGLFETLWVTFGPFWALKVFKIDFYDEA